MIKTTAMILAGGINLDFSVLTHNRVKSAMPVCGQFRIIDFILTNLSNTGIQNVGVLIQYLPGSLIDHVGVGKPWDMDSSNRHIKLMPPFMGMGKTKWFRGSGDAIYQNLTFVRDTKAEHVLILTADHLYGMNYSQMIEQHNQTNADLTILTTNYPKGYSPRLFGFAQYGEDNLVTHFEEKPAEAISDTISTGVYLIKANVLIEMLEQLHKEEEINHNLPKCVIEPLVKAGNSYGHRFEGEWEYLSDMQDYIRYHRRLIRGESCVDPGQLNILTNLQDRALGSRPSPFFGNNSHVEDSLISPGCVIHGSVVRSVLSPGIHVAAGAKITDSILFHDCQIQENAQLTWVVSDKDCIFESNCQIGNREDAGGDFEKEKITVIGKEAHIAQGLHVPTGCVVPIDKKVDQRWIAGQTEKTTTPA